RPPIAVPARPHENTAAKSMRDILTAESGHFVPAKVYDRSTLAIGLEIQGPGIVEQPDTTTLIEPGWRATVVADGALIITAAGGNKSCPRLLIPSPSKSFATSSTASPTKCSRRC